MSDVDEVQQLIALTLTLDEAESLHVAVLMVRAMQIPGTMNLGALAARLGNAIRCTPPAA